MKRLHTAKFWWLSPVRFTRPCRYSLDDLGRTDNGTAGSPDYRYHLWAGASRTTHRSLHRSKVVSVRLRALLSTARDTWRIPRPEACSAPNISGPKSRAFPPFRWWAVRGSNPRPSRCKRDALPTELTAPQPGIGAIAGIMRKVKRAAAGKRGFDHHEFDPRVPK